jgi:CBS domain containing-hemolysin-like protein
VTVVAADGRLRGWVDGEMLRGKGKVEEVEPRKFGAYVTLNDSLRQALDSIVTSRTQVAVVATEDDRYLGILTLERISQEIVS